MVALDLGQSSVKALAIDPEGRVRAKATAPYPSSTPRPGWVEQVPDDWWEAACAALRQCWDELERQGLGARDVAAVGLSGHMSGLVLVDREGRPVRPCITISDGRSTEEAEDLGRRMGEAVRRVTGNPVINGFMLPKLEWVRRHEGEAFARARKALMPKDYLRLRLTGAVATEPTDAANTLLLDPVRRTWSDELKAAAEVPDGLLPELVETLSVAGRVSQEAARESGLVAGTPVVAGGADMACSNAGIGAVEPGVVAVTMGTAAQVVATVDRIYASLFGQMTFHPQAEPGALYVMGSHFTGGLAMAWLAQALARQGEGAAAAVPFEELEAEAAACPPGAQGALWLPFLVGSGTPSFDPALAATWLGLRAGHRRGHLVRSVMEGVAFNLRESVALLEQAGLGPQEIRIGAGGLRSGLWRLILAGVLGKPLRTVEVGDVSAFGAALMAGVGAGWWANLREAVRSAVRLGPAVEPPDGWRAAYDALFPAYLAAVRRVAGYYHEFSS